MNLTRNHKARLSTLAAAVFFAALMILTAIPLDQADAQRRGGGGRGGGFSRPSGGARTTRPAPRPSPRPSTGARPGAGPSYGARPGTGRPSQLPSGGNINTGRNDINIDRGDINVDVDNGWGGGWDDDWGAFAAGAVIGGVTGAALAAPSVVYALPPGCTTVVINGVAYQDCGGTYYQPSYQGADVVYQSVPAP